MAREPRRDDSNSTAPTAHSITEPITHPITEPITETLPQPRYYRIAQRTIEVHVRGENLGFHSPEWTRWEPFRIITSNNTDKSNSSNKSNRPTSNPTGNPSGNPSNNPKPDIIYKFKEQKTVTAENGEPYPLGPPTIIKHSKSRFTVGLVGFHMDLQLGNPITAHIQLRQGFMAKAFRVPISIHLMENDHAFMLHSSAVIPPGHESAHIFFAEPDTGKTTAARYSPKGSAILSDETTAIFPNKKAVMSTPFGGDLPPLSDNLAPHSGDLAPSRARKSAQGAPIAGMYYLEQSPQDRLTKMSMKEAVPLILRQTMLTALNPEHTAKAFDAACKLCTKVPVYRLECRNQGLFWPMLLENQSLLENDPKKAKPKAKNSIKPNNSIEPNNSIQINLSDKTNTNPNTQNDTPLEKISHGPS